MHSAFGANGRLSIRAFEVKPVSLTCGPKRGEFRRIEAKTSEFEAKSASFERCFWLLLMIAKPLSWVRFEFPVVHARIADAVRVCCVLCSEDLHVACSIAGGSRESAGVFL